MALVKKSNSFYVCFRDADKVKWVSLGNVTEEQAKEYERVAMEAIRAKRQIARLNALFGNDNSAGEKPPKKSGLPLADLLPIAKRYRAFSVCAERDWRNFCAAMGEVSASEITPKMCLEYMQGNFSDGSAKRYNNVLGELRLIFAHSLIDAGLNTSPFENVKPRRSTDVEHYRRLMPYELERIFEALGKYPYWECLAKISLYTGLRLETCRRLAPEHIKNGIITIMPSKTARFGRAVQIALLPELAEYLNSFQNGNSCAPYCERFRRIDTFGSDRRHAFFVGFLLSLGIEDSEEGKASFHSLRVTFVSRLSENGVSEKVIRGIVGHTSTQMTDLYNHDSVSMVKELNGVRIL